MADKLHTQVDNKIVKKINHKDFLLRNIETIFDIFEALYKSPDHRNKSNPLDELIYIHLSKKTNESGYTQTYDKLY